MSRKRTGLRNRFRNGQGTYSRLDKASTADRYGEWKYGQQTRSEKIAGSTLVIAPKKEKLS